MTDKSYGNVPGGNALTDGQKEFLLDIEAEDEASRDNSDAASLRGYLRGFGEYRRIKAELLAKHA